MLFSLLLVFWVCNPASTIRSWSKQIDLDTKECNGTKFCMMKPAGCNPSENCIQGVMLSVVGPNQLKVEMFAQSLVPSVPMQFIAVGFSKDQIMGDDLVSECVVSGTAVEGGEVFLAFNTADKSNDRILLDDLEAEAVYSDIRSSIVNGRIACSFIQSIRPEIASAHENRIVDLDAPFFVFGATGAAEPNGIKPHNFDRNSARFPLISPEKINPATIGNNAFVHPASFLNKQPSGSVTSRPQVGSCSGIFSVVALMILLTQLLF